MVCQKTKISGLHCSRSYAAKSIIVALLVSLLSTSQFAHADLNPRDQVMPAMHTNWLGPDAQFVTASIEDSKGWWWGTDNDGLWHFSPKGADGQRWEHFRAEDGLYDDSITALCIDRKGRLWVGTERRGVSVYNNSWWQNYDFMTGPIGVHISSIALNPINGDVWISSEAGIAIYSDQRSQWTYRNTSNGLTSDKVNSVAFTLSGVAIVGTYDNGVLIGKPSDNYSTWADFTAPANATTSETGSGIPSNQVNCVIVNKAGTIYCGTSSGLGWSTDTGKTWQFLHGFSWQSKITQFTRATQQIQADELVPTMDDEYVTSLADDKGGYLYVGHRHGGVEILDDKTQNQIYHNRLIEYGTYIRSLTLLSHGGLLVGNYGDGISRVAFDGIAAKAVNTPVPNQTITTFPVPAAPPSSSDVESIAKTLNAAAKDTNIASAYFLGEDWQTQGNWVGRYGLQYAELCAESGNQDYVSSTIPGYTVTPNIGLNGPSNVSHWLQWESSGDPRVLYDPLTEGRREAEWDDQGENNDILSEGPDIWINVQVPSGAHRLALYFMNKDGHSRTTRFRDYVVQIMPATAGVDFRQTYNQPSTLPVLAETRVENFWPGVFQDFVLVGPASYYVKISRNFSINTIVQGVFLDELSLKSPLPVAPWMKGFSLLPSLHTAKASSAAKLSKDQIASLLKIKKLWLQLDGMFNHSASAAFERDDRALLIRAAAAAGASPELLTDWRVQSGLWTGDDWSIFFAALQKLDNATTKSTLLK